MPVTFAWRRNTGRRIVEMVWEDLTPNKIQTAQSVRECDHGGDGDGLFDQRDHPSDRAGPSRRAGHRTRRFRNFGQPQGACDRQCAAERRQIPDGGLFLCRRSSRPDEPHLTGASASRRHDRDRCRRSATTSRAPKSTTTTSFALVKDPIYAEGALAVLKGNLAPDGCVIKPSACEPRLFSSTPARRWCSTIIPR